MKNVDLEKNNFLKTEIIAGITTFLTMSYIIIVNPSILGTEGTGMSFSGVMCATILTSFLATLMMGLYAKVSFALAPGMGLNAFFTYTLILGEKIPYQDALGMVFWSGAFFVVISVTPLRVHILKSIPFHLRAALAGGIGLFLVFIGLKNGHIIIGHPVTLLQHAPFSIEMMLTIISFIFIIFFQNKKNPLTFIISIFFITIVSLFFNLTKAPVSYFSMPDLSTHFLELNILGSLKLAYLPAIFTLILTDLFDSISTFVGVSQAANMVDETGEPKNMKKALVVDSFATLISGLFGTSAATTYIESSSGVEVGGRTGLVSVVTAFCFLPFLFFGPLIQMIPSFATASILIYIGFQMFKHSVASFDTKKMEDIFPAMLVIILIPLTFSITKGIMWGFLFHCILYLVMKRRKELTPMVLILGIISILNLIDFI